MLRIQSVSLRKIIRFGLPFLLAMLGVYWLSQKVKWSAVTVALQQQTVWSLCLVAVLIPLGVFFRACSWQLVFSERESKPTLKALFWSYLASISAGILIPAAGEVSRVLSAAHWTHHSKATILRSVVTHRILDLCVQIPLFFLSIFLLFGKKISALETDFSLPSFAVFFLLILVAAFFLRERIAGAFPTFIEWLIALKEQFVDFFQAPKRLLLFVFLVVLVRFKGALQYYVLAQCYPETADISLWIFFLFTIFTTGATTLIPTQGGLGPWHWAAGQVFLLFFISYESALTIATSMHLVSLVFGLLNGLPLLLYYFYGKKNVEKP